MSHFMHDSHPDVNDPRIQNSDPFMGFPSIWSSPPATEEQKVLAPLPPVVAPLLDSTSVSSVSHSDDPVKRPRLTSPVQTSWSNSSASSASSSSTATISPTRVGGRYVLQERLGAGMFGAVFKAWDEQTRQVVAIKVFDLYSDEAKHDMLYEVSVLRFLAPSRLNRVIQLLHDPIYSDDRHKAYEVLTYVSGKDLSDFVLQMQDDGVSGITTRHQASQVVVDLMLSLAQTLKAVNEACVVHRDVKPINIMVDLEHHPWLVDLGLACVIRACASSGSVALDGYCAPNEAAGTPNYMAPELRYGRQPASFPLWNRIDVYSLAASFRFVLGGDTLIPEMDQLLEDMRTANPINRPTWEEVIPRIQQLQTILAREPHLFFDGFRHSRHLSS